MKNCRSHLPDVCNARRLSYQAGASSAPTTGKGASRDGCASASPHSIASQLQALAAEEDWLRQQYLADLRVLEEVCMAGWGLVGAGGVRLPDEDAFLSRFAVCSWCPFFVSGGEGAVMRASASLFCRALLLVYLLLRYCFFFYCCVVVVVVVEVSEYV